MSNNDKSQKAIEARPVPGADLCETTEKYADYWKRGAHNEPDRSGALICMEQAVNGWKNLAYDLARQVHYAMRAGYIDDPRAEQSANTEIPEAIARMLELRAHSIDRKEATGAMICAATALRDVAGEIRCQYVLEKP